MSAADPERWRQHARCLAAPDDEAAAMRDAEAWDEQVEQLASVYCGSCPVQAECLASAIEWGDWGIRGGTLLHAGNPVPRTDPGARRLTDDEAAQWLAAQLAGGPLPTATVRARASAVPGLSWAAVTRARHSAGVVSHRPRGQDSFLLTPAQDAARQGRGRQYVAELLADHEPHTRQELLGSAPSDLSRADVEAILLELGAVAGRAGKYAAVTYTLPEPAAPRRAGGQRCQPRRARPRSARRRARTAA